GYTRLVIFHEPQSSIGDALPRKELTSLAYDPTDEEIEGFLWNLLCSRWRDSIGHPERAGLLFRKEVPEVDPSQQPWTVAGLAQALDRNPAKIWRRIPALVALHLSEEDTWRPYADWFVYGNKP